MDKLQFSRRQALKTAAAGLTTGLATLGAPGLALAAGRTVKIGLVAPQTGPLAAFSEQLPFVIEQVQQKTGGTIAIAGKTLPLEILVRDSQSNPNRAAEVAKTLLLDDKVDLILAFATPETVNPVADQAELAGAPCLSNDAPIEPYFFGRNGDPKKGFDWTYHFFFSAQNMAETYFAGWDALTTNKVIGALWPNDNDGLAFEKIIGGMAKAKGYKIVDPGRFDLPSGNFNSQIAAFKSAGVEILHGVLPPPEFTALANASAQQNFHPKAITFPKASEFPASVAPLGDRAIGLTTEVWWSPTHPFSSSLTGQSSAALASAYEAASGKQWSMALGFRHALFEVALDALKRTKNIDDPASIRDALAATNLATIVGPVNFAKGFLPNCARTPLVLGQWRKGSGKFPLDLVNVNNATAPEIPVAGPVLPIG